MQETLISKGVSINTLTADIRKRCIKSSLCDSKLHFNLSILFMLVNCYKNTIAHYTKYYRELLKGRFAVGSTFLNCFKI